jgi:hypothetical protein
MANTPAPAAAGGALAALGNLKGAIQNVKAAVIIAGGDPILRLGRDGKWVFGADNFEPEEGSRWMVNPLSLRFGQVCWKVIPQGSKEKPELYGKKLVSVFGNAKPIGGQAHDSNGNPVNHDQHPWQDVVGVDLLCISGEDEGEQVIYEPSSTGGLRAMDDLMDAISKAQDEHPDRIVPIVELKSDSYNHAQYGKTYIPVLKIVDWATNDAIGQGAAPAEEADTKTETKQTSAAQTEAPEQTAASEAPSTAEPQGERRRRRRAA